MERPWIQLREQSLFKNNAVEMRPRVDEAKCGRSKGQTKRGEPRAFPGRPSVSSRLDWIDVDNGQVRKKESGGIGTCRLARDENRKGAE